MTPTDSDDWDPIAGVDLKTYARVTEELIAGGVISADADVLVAALGVAADDWHYARDCWLHRIASDEELRHRYSEYYQHARDARRGYA